MAGGMEGVEGERENYTYMFNFEQVTGEEGGEGGGWQPRARLPFACLLCWARSTLAKVEAANKKVQFATESYCGGLRASRQDVISALHPHE